MCRFQYKFESTPLIFSTQFPGAFVVTVAINGKYFPIRSSLIGLSSGNIIFCEVQNESLCAF